MPAPIAPPTLVSARLRDAREAAGLTQHEFAAAVGTSQARVTDWEARGAPIRDSWRALIQQTLGLPPGTILDWMREEEITRVGTRGFHLWTAPHVA